MKILKKITLAVCLIFALTAVVACKESPLQSVSDMQEYSSQSILQEEQGSEESETSQEDSAESDTPTSSDGLYEEVDSDDVCIGGEIIPGVDDFV